MLSVSKSIIYRSVGLRVGGIVLNGSSLLKPATCMQCSQEPCIDLRAQEPRIPNKRGTDTEGTQEMQGEVPTDADESNAG